jgi:hypothetical protein
VRDHQERGAELGVEADEEVEDLLGRLGVEVAGTLQETYPMVLCAPGPVAGAHLVTYA